MPEPRATDAAHERHDLYVLAAAADRGATPGERATAERQAAGCSECRAFLDDLESISTVLAALPREVPAPRDFRLSPERAARLRRPGWRDRLGALTRTPSLRPLATGLATLGFAGLLFTVVVPSAFGPTQRATISAPGVTSDNSTGGAGAAGAPASTATAPEAVSGSGKGSASTAPGVDASAASGPGSGGGLVPHASAATASGGAFAVDASGATATASTPQVGSGGTAPTAPASTPLDLLPWVSAAALVVGLGLLLASRLGERARAG